MRPSTEDSYIQTRYVHYVLLLAYVVVRRAIYPLYTINNITGPA